MTSAAVAPGCLHRLADGERDRRRLLLLVAGDEQIDAGERRRARARTTRPGVEGLGRADRLGQQTRPRGDGAGGAPSGIDVLAGDADVADELLQAELGMAVGRRRCGVAARRSRSSRQRRGPGRGREGPRRRSAGGRSRSGAPPWRGSSRWSRRRRSGRRQLARAPPRRGSAVAAGGGIDAGRARRGAPAIARVTIFRNSSVSWK